MDKPIIVNGTQKAGGGDSRLGFAVLVWLATILPISIPLTIVLWRLALN